MADIAAGDIATDLLCVGNPLLDMSLKISDGQLLAKYELVPDNQIEAGQHQKPLFDQVFSSDCVSFSPGGSAQNTARIYRWVLGERARVAYIGSVGADKFGRRLEELVRADGVDTRYIVHEDLPTGRSVNLIWGANRSLVADIGAANYCRPERVFIPHNLALLTSANYVYIEGFFVTHDPETAVQIARFCSDAGKPLVFSLSGTYVCEGHADTICQMLPHVSYLFGHVTEYDALAKTLGLKEFEVTLLGYLRLKNACDNRRQTVDAMTQAEGHESLPDGETHTGHVSCLRMVVTQSAEPVILLDGMDALCVPVPPISDELIADTTGAGDAVVGGFLAGLHLDSPMEECVRFGVMAAREVIQLMGCSVPARPHPLVDPGAENTPN